MAISPQRLLLVLLCLFSELSNTLAFTSFSTNSRGSSSWASGGHALVGNERGRVVIVSVGRKKDAEPAPSPQTPAAPAAAKKAPAKKADAVAPVAAAAATGGVPGEAPAKAPRAPAPPLVKKADFLAIISEKTGLTKKDSESALDAIFDTITEEVLAGKKLTLSGFGTFSLKQRAARKGRNPKTGEEMSLPASKAMGFSPSKGLKELMKGSVDK